MRNHKLLPFVLILAATAGLMQAQPPGAGLPPGSGHVGGVATEKDKLFGSKTPSDEDPNGRKLLGAVTNENGDLVNGAVVFLKNLKSGKERSFFTKKDGKYRFEKLRMDADYEMMAKFNGIASEIKKLSMYDNRKEAVRNLVIPNKPAAPAPPDNPTQEKAPQEKVPPAK